MTCRDCGVFCTTNISVCESCLEKRTVVVGTIEVLETIRVERGSESANAYHTIEVQPGSYPIVVGVSRFDGSRYLAVRYTGKVVSSGYGNKSYPTGHVDQVSEQPYKYAVREGTYRAKTARISLTDLETFELVKGV